MYSKYLYFYFKFILIIYKIKLKLHDDNIKYVSFQDYFLKFLY